MNHRKHLLDAFPGVQLPNGTIATSPLALRWMHGSPRTECVYMWHEQATIQWSQCLMSIVACCHSVKLCAHAAQAFQLQQYKLRRMTSIIHCCSKKFLYNNVHGATVQLAFVKYNNGFDNICKKIRC